MVGALHHSRAWVLWLEIADRTVVMFNGELYREECNGSNLRTSRASLHQSPSVGRPEVGIDEGRARPMRFPTVDKVTGASDVPAETTETVKQKDRPVLEVSNLTTRFDVRSGLFGKITSRVHAVEGISFSMLPGETLSLVGESGWRKIDDRSIQHSTSESAEVRLDHD